MKPLVTGVDIVKETLHALREVRVSSYDDGRKQGATAERAKIVAWLRKQAESMDFHGRGDERNLLYASANNIERGEHDNG